MGHDILPKNYRKQQFHYFLKPLSSVGTSVNNSHDYDVQCQIWPVWTGPHKFLQHTNVNTQPNWRDPVMGQDAPERVSAASSKRNQLLRSLCICIDELCVS